MPDRFARKWLAFDDRRPIRWGLARRLISAVIAMLVLAALLVWLTAR